MFRQYFVTSVTFNQNLPADFWDPGRFGAEDQEVDAADPTAQLEQSSMNHRFIRTRARYL